MGISCPMLTDLECLVSQMAEGWFGSINMLAHAQAYLHVVLVTRLPPNNRREESLNAASENSLCLFGSSIPELFLQGRVVRVREETIQLARNGCTVGTNVFNQTCTSVERRVTP